MMFREPQACERTIALSYGAVSTLLRPPPPQFSRPCKPWSLAAMDLFHRLPYEAQLLVMRCVAHPAALHLQRSARFEHLAAIAAGWYPDWRKRRDDILRYGLPAKVQSVEVGDAGFFATYFQIDEAHLPRSHESRGFPLHLTIGYTSDWRPGVAEERRARLTDRWAGRDLRVRISWVGSGGAAFIRDGDWLAKDYDIVWLHRRGHYRDRDLHISL